MSKIKVNEITEKNKKKIYDELVKYKFIMNSKGTIDENFKDAFNDFYLKCEKEMKNSKNKDVFFNKLKGCLEDESINDESLIDIVIYLKENMLINKLEFSFSTKLLHTVDDNYPIYDKHVAEYLKNNENVDLYFNFKNPNKIDYVIHDWKLLLEWYRKFLITDEAKEWINWFDKEFPSFSYISKVKKIDFIIYVCYECFQNRRRIMMKDYDKLNVILDGKNINFIIGSGASAGEFPTLKINNKFSYEDLFSSDEIEFDNKKVLYYFYFHNIISKMVSKDYKDYNPKVKENYLKLITTLVEILNNQGIERPKRANIFTTNYDLFFEYTFEEYSKNKSNCFFNDGSVGFVNRYLNNGWYNLSVASTGYTDNFKREIPSINLYKLHGSISWEYDENNQDRIKVNYNRKDKKSIFSKDLENCDNDADNFLLKMEGENDISKINDYLKKVYQGNSNSFDEFYSLYFKEFQIVNPSNYKFEKTIFQEHYYQLLRSLCYELEKKNSVLIVFGFSFADQHILEMFLRILNNPELQVIVIAFLEKDKNDIKNKLGNYKNIVYLPKDFNKYRGDFDYLNKCINGEIDE